ncbi:two-component system response regulator YesN [Paenibacillus rhizosphaerae]|uniref:Two-component system response regulator YesN n=1 Tax=Paenibacillus rhizosphaerae TaxID=297318 RepID=A0A839TPF4_9BACL|nr:response regulator [Paenibacillus rhizosphaerae]MBB3128451.1 two-component system response regulator YesN [Paenibacillus rhizosphaerae]
MYRLLIVDDEPYIVSSLKDMFEDSDRMELDIYCAGSASEALDVMEKTRVDIVLSDIRMPGMSGLELLERVKGKWPACKVIFLSGHNEFTYVQAAMRHGIAGYLLKTDDEEEIVEAVRKAVDELGSEQAIQNLIESAHVQIKKALPMLQKDFLTSIVTESPVDEGACRRRFEELSIGLDAALPVMLVIGRVDRWPDDFTLTDKELMLFAVQNIAAEVLAHTADMVTVVSGRARFFWLVQPKRADTAVPIGADVSTRVIHELLDYVQAMSRKLLKLTISLSFTAQPFRWENLPQKYEALNRLLIRGLGDSEEMLLVERGDAYENDAPETASLRREKMTHLRQFRLNQLKTLIESGQQEAYFELLDDVLQQGSGDTFSDLQEIYYSIAVMLLSQINRWSVYAEIDKAYPVSRLLVMESHGSWPDACRFVRGISAGLFERLRQENTDRSNEVIRRLHEYIAGHIDGDLSLVRLADVVELNASYLCRFYKQQTGIGLSDYISELKLNAAKRMLSDTRMKISEIATRIGFESGYFSRYFKKETSLTPQEYREKVGGMRVAEPSRESSQ